MKSYLIDACCNYCGLPLRKRISDDTKNKTHFYCSKEHRQLDPNRPSQSGENNPNYGNRWTDDQRQALSVKKTIFYKENPDIAYECGKTNRGKHISEEITAKRLKTRSEREYGPRVHSHETLEIIGKKSSEKFTEEYKVNTRKTMEDRGYWVSLDTDIGKYRSYFRLSNWKPFSEVYCEEDKRRVLQERGLFSYKNRTGVVRDHWFGRREGWLLQVPPEILHHPENLEILEHSDNIKKGFIDKSLGLEQSVIRLELLLKKIKIFNAKFADYPELEKTTEYIKHYEQRKVKNI